MVELLTVRDKSLASVVERYGMPPLWPREPGFPTLLHIILEQQVSLASAKTAFDRLCEAVGDPPTPAKFLTLGDAELKTIGFSRQKTRYGRELRGQSSRAALTWILSRRWTTTRCERN